MTILRPALKIIAKSLYAGHVSARGAVRMAAYAVLAKLAAGDENGHAMTYKMHVGAMRGTFRREVEARRAEAMVAAYRKRFPEIAAMWA